MKKLLKFSIFFILSTSAFYFIINLSSLGFHAKLAAPEDTRIITKHSYHIDSIVKDKNSVEAPALPAPPALPDAIQMNSVAAWLNWLVASLLTMVTYFVKRGIDHFFIKREIPLKEE